MKDTFFMNSTGKGSLEIKIVCETKDNLVAEGTLEF
jgi:hypothetical protein